MDRVEGMIIKLALSDIGLINGLRLFSVFNKFDKEEGIKYLKKFIMVYYSMEKDMPDEFYDLILEQIYSGKYLSLYYILVKRDIFILISYLKYDNEDVSILKDGITPLQYFSILKRYINSIVDKLLILEKRNNDSVLDNSIKDEDLWLLRRIPHYQLEEYVYIAYKMYLSIGLNNSLELIDGKYGQIDYEKIFFMFYNLEVNHEIDNLATERFCKYLLGNKKDYNNVIRQMLRGEFNDLFLNFDYFYNNFSYFIDRLGLKMSKERVVTLIKDRFITYSPVEPQITGDIFVDMVSSYHNKYIYLGVSEEEIYKKNIDMYNKYLKYKYKSSIPRISIDNKDGFICEVLKLSDPRNLVLGYRSGNCFRINGDASSLFYNFLKNEHMRLVSISTIDNKDYAMMLVMRNGNVLIGQGIEVSKWVSSDVKGFKLYNYCRLILKEMMNYMNSCGDEIVATIIGSSNENVSIYNNSVLPFIVNPILGDSGSYYNGIYNYQCLLDLYDGMEVKDIRLYVPYFRYCDEREKILRRHNGSYDSNYREIEKRLIALRFIRSQSEGGFEFYHTLFEHKEVYTCCNKDWYITLFDDGFIDSFVDDVDDRAVLEYRCELENVNMNIIGKSRKKKF